jgi:polyhydroxybutyrate depolymerase
VPDGGIPYGFCPSLRASGPFVQHLGPATAGCAAPAAPRGVIDLADAGWVTSGGLLVVPPGPPDVPLPVVLVFHGSGSSGAQIRDWYDIEAAADGGAIFIYPDAARQRAWDLGPAGRDFPMVQNVLERLGKEYCVDGTHIFATGMSAGAVFTFFLGCNAGSTFRAIGPIAGTEERFFQSCCEQPVSAIVIHGTADSAIPFYEGQAAMGEIVDRDDCSTTTSPDGPYCVAYATCSTGKEVDWCTHGGGHIIPDWAGTEVWRFFTQAP